METEGRQADYDAFISYCHAWDKDIAKAFHGQLRSFGRPWHRSRNLKLFRDATNLAASPQPDLIGVSCRASAR
ncbi:hypothetical protein ACFRKB_36530 [Streptomyces scopuliridis]|uniref:hypothetical protein n=1 Tax=Streptomyces scopuliridis TaxID=452529 RepID=UPI003698E280